jgi:arginyl-tRNA synthetase
MVLERMLPSELFHVSSVSGYLNCTFEPGRYVKDLAVHMWSRGGDIGLSPPNGERVTVEHTSANPNGPFHVGRARNPVLGDTLVRMLRADGSEVEAQYWVNDMGKQAMLLVWGMHNIDASELGPAEREKKDHQLVRFYQAANAKMETDPSMEPLINVLLRNYEAAVASLDMDRVISAEGRPVIRAKDVRSACEQVLDGMKSSLSDLNVAMDSFVYESKVVSDGSLQRVIEGLRKSPLCREENGALYLDLTGLVDEQKDEEFKKRFVLTRSDGSGLYTTRDIGYHLWKLSMCDRAINVLGEDHKYQSLQLSIALKELGQERLPETMFYSFVSLPEGKMSTRRNRVVFLDDLLDEAVSNAREEVLKRRSDLSPEGLEAISRSVGIGALRFNMVRVQPDKQIVFRWEEALNFDGASAPFVQYSHARACSILGKDPSGFLGEVDWSMLVEPSEMKLVRKLSELGPVISLGARERKVHLMAPYLVELASFFNEFYRDCPVLKEEDPSRRKARMALVELSRRVLGRGLWCLGIDAPMSM